MEHQDTNLTSMRPRLKELNDNPYLRLNAGDPRVAYIDQSRNFGKENLIYFPYMRIHSFEQQHMANISRIME